MKLSHKSVKVEIPNGTSGETRTIDLKFVSNCHTIFHNCQHLLLQLDSTQRSFLDFLIERMSQENWLMVSKPVKSDFKVFLSQITSGKKTISERSLENYLGFFTSLHLLIKSKTTVAGYYVNPKYFSHGGVGEREKIVKRFFKKASLGEIDIEPLLDKPLSEYGL